MIKRILTAAIIAQLALAGASRVHAQTPPPAVPAPAAPAATPTAPPASTPAGGAVPAAVADPRFKIGGFNVRGATVVSKEEIALTLLPYTGANRDFSDVQKALEALEKIFTSKGFSAVQVILPEQDITDGEVEFDVVEAKIGRLVVEGNKYFDEANVRASLPRVVPGQPPNIFVIAEALRLANENPAKQTTLLLRSGSEEGQVDAVVRVIDERPNKISLTLDNSGTQQTGLFRLGMGYQNANVFNRDHVVNAQYVSAPNQAYKADRISLYPSKNVFIVGGGYRVPLYSNGDSVEVSAGYSNVNSGTIANLFSISGSGAIFGARYNHNLPKWRDVEQKLTYGLDWRGYRSNVTQVGVPGNLVPDVTVHPISLTYAGNHRKGEGDSNFYLSVHQNLPGGNDGGTRAFQGDLLTVPILPAARQGGTPPQGANPRYFATRWGFNHNRALPRDWQFRFGMNGQMTRDKMIGGEQFGIGGADSVRGFLEREVSNDNGYRGTFEFYTPDFGNVVPVAGARLRAVVFYDWGGVRRIGPLSTASPGLQNVIGSSATEIHGQHIGSAGVGVRFSHGTNLSFRLDLATVMDAGGVQKTGDVRLHSSLAYIF